MFYDPMGILQPIMINFKIFCQQICRKKLTTVLMIYMAL